jgi:hypothetical protein
VKKTYHIVSREEKTAAASIEQFAKSNGQFLLPLVELVTQARIAVDEVITSIGRKTIETLLALSAEQVAGTQTPGKASGDIRWHGSQNGRVMLADRRSGSRRKSALIGLVRSTCRRAPLTPVAPKSKRSCRLL